MHGNTVINAVIHESVKLDRWPHSSYGMRRRACLSLLNPLQPRCTMDGNPRRNCLHAGRQAGHIGRPADVRIRRVCRGFPVPGR